MWKLSNLDTMSIFISKLDNVSKFQEMRSYFSINLRCFSSKFSWLFLLKYFILFTYWVFLFQLLIVLWLGEEFLKDSAFSEKCQNAVLQ